MNSIKRVGVIGGGQLAWMMGDAAKALDIELIVQTPQATDPAAAIASETILAPIDDAAATALLAEKCDVITFENEFINLEALMPLQAKGICFRPRLEVLAPLLDKYHQRCYLRDIGLPVPQFVAPERNEGLGTGDWGLGEDFSPGFPVVLKVRRHGYDGQGTFILKDRQSLEATLEKIGETPVLLEEFVPFSKELAVIAARSVDGEIVTYPVVETQQEDQVCRRVLVPADIDPGVQLQVESIAHTLLESLQAIGLFGIELFLTTNGKILVNEIAPRTHNSGHFTIDASYTSQFEMHLRSVSGLPLGNPALKCDAAVMVNLLGYEHSHSDYQEKRQKIAQIPNCHLLWYGKTESRPGRKLGHVTILLNHTPESTSTTQQLQQLAEQVESIW
ncbi:5-(carboxyamino)imidazole ribonucleotide synthase [Aerosakkonemataceae cyanobacterium BLCC-F154]|uniref:N5-carboxyaminoimidazole ribonucleotide synthase n=1 Tax=Floridaenema fluviatile BLCC-F154 TaxID=3153640 RepID=A0ABV4YIY2_9CYAN